jgi:SAM-dependent methyltransferase
MKLSICPLCSCDSEEYFQKNAVTYYLCKNCKGIFIDDKYKPNSETELLHYKTHQNDVNDSRYQQFVSPITFAILREYDTTSLGLDFGAGSGPVISKILKDNNRNINIYDPYFFDFPSLLDLTYDFIACCEVIEHFYNPKKEFELLVSLLKPNGKLFCMTELYDDSIDFGKWYYKNDPTHVFMYQRKTFEYIAEEFAFSNCKIENRLIVLTKKS